MNNEIHKLAWVVIRLLMAGMFIESGIDKLIHWNGYLEEIIAKGIPFPVVGLTMAIATEVLGSAALISGIFIGLGALILASYIFVLNFFYFDFWNFEGMEAITLRKEFLKDLGVIAGLLLITLRERNVK